MGSRIGKEASVFAVDSLHRGPRGNDSIGGTEGKVVKILEEVCRLSYLTLLLLMLKKLSLMQKQLLLLVRTTYLMTRMPGGELSRVWRLVDEHGVHGRHLGPGEVLRVVQQGRIHYVLGQDLVVGNVLNL